MFDTKAFPSETVSALVDASAAINSAQDLGATLEAIAGAAAAVMRAEASSVIVLDETRGKQVFAAAIGDRASQLIGVEYDQGVGISGKVIEAGAAVIVNDVSRDKAHYKRIDEFSATTTRSLIAAPLIHKAKTLGVVEVLNPIEADRFTQTDRALCQVFANLAAIATANAQRCDSLQRENRGWRAASRGPVEMVGRSPAMLEVRKLIRRVARSSTTALLLGETGTGKELAARMIHAESDRAEHPFIAINCAALPESLLESELFGHEAGAFTGAVSKKLGQFELGHQGTIFLDEMAEAPSNIQVKLLRVLENKEITRVGGSQPITCDVRIIAATNKDLSEELRTRRFRDDLYYRLNVFAIKLPALRQRPGDVELLADHFVKRFAGEMKIAPPTISPAAMEALKAYGYPGNVRELQNILERACLLCPAMDADRPRAEPACIGVEHLPPEVQGIAPPPGAAAAAGAAGGSKLADQEKALIRNALIDSGWNQSAAARALGISRDNLRYRMKKYGLRKPRE